MAEQRFSIIGSRNGDGCGRLKVYRTSPRREGSRNPKNWSSRLATAPWVCDVISAIASAYRRPRLSRRRAVTYQQEAGSLIFPQLFFGNVDVVPTGTRRWTDARDTERIKRDRWRCFILSVGSLVSLMCIFFLIMHEINCWLDYGGQRAASFNICKFVCVCRRGFLALSMFIWDMLGLW